MAERSWTTVDKSEWGDGPWTGEPDKIQWVDAATGLDCLIHRGPSGALCGYVGVPQGHPAYGVGYDDVRNSDGEYPDVHGGLTYAAACMDTDDESHGICHVPEPGRPHDVWWLGFDCGHFSDLMPGLVARERIMARELETKGIKWPESPYGSTYKTVDYVREEVANLASQLRNARIVPTDDLDAA
jgi:hypothetical protein